MKRVGLYYWTGWTILRAHFSIRHRIKSTGIEYVPLEGGLIIASNHSSHLDSPPIAIMIPRKVRFISDVGMFENKWLAWFYKSIDVIPFRRGGGGKDMIDAAVVAINKGDAIIIYPEGTRTRTGYPGPPRTGFIVIAARTGAPIVPARISGTFDVNPPGSRYGKSGPIFVAYGKPIYLDIKESDIENHELMLENAEAVMDEIHKLPGWLPRTAVKPVNDGSNHN
ncbi:MAG: lysophospholipid acyltransferase family protein [bacterium]